MTLLASVVGSSPASPAAVSPAVSHDIVDAIAEAIREEACGAGQIAWRFERDSFLAAGRWSVQARGVLRVKVAIPAGFEPPAEVPIGEVDVAADGVYEFRHWVIEQKATFFADWAYLEGVEDRDGRRLAAYRID